MLLRLNACLLAALLLAAGTGCDTQEEQRDFAEEAFSTPSGFVRTEADGTLVQDDPDDWRTAPRYANSVFVQPAFPNPTVGEFVTIPVSVQQFNAVPGGLRLVTLDGSSTTQRFITLSDLPEADAPGAYVFFFSPVTIGRRGLVRVFVVDGRSELVSYGDLFVE